MTSFSFTEHPETVGETYGQHFRVAVSFAVRMICAGLACLVHGFLPFLFTTTGSSAIRRLNEQMVLHRAATREVASVCSAERVTKRTHVQAAAIR